jgi:uncharacterized membrane protein
MENILALGRRRRLLNGIIMSVVTLAVAVALVLLSAGPPWFALVFVLAFLSTVMLLQARERT